MIFFKKRLVIWLIRAYLKRWGKRILFFFTLGLLTFFILLKIVTILIPKIPVGEKQSIGLVGAYHIDTLPSSIISEISRGLTSLDDEGLPKPDVASSWEIKDGGKTYVFHLRKDIYFTDLTPLSSAFINYSFSDVSIERPNRYTIVFHLKDSYSPFLVTMSRPVLKNNLVGVGEYKIKNIKLNGGFVESLTLVLVKNQYFVKIYHFYPSSEALKIAFALGEVSHGVGLPNTQFQNVSFTQFPHVKLKKDINTNRLVTLFFNTKDKIVSDEKIRNGLSYGLPDTFDDGKRVYSSYLPTFWAYSHTLVEKRQDFSHARLLLTKSDDPSVMASLALTLHTLPKYKKAAKAIAKEWKKLGVKTKIEIVDTVPVSFQIFLGDFRVPKDPDQYTLWHKDQENNITKYESPRIDKLLEEGRKKTDISERKKIYADFQKYLLADSPAAFLYFPYEYTLERE